MSRIDINPSYEFQGNQLLGYYAKGHHDPEQFLYELIAEYDPVTDDPFNPDRYTVERVRVEYWRNVPTGDGWIYLEKQKPGRGAYPVTYLEVY